MAIYKQWREEKRTYLKDVIPLDTPYNLKVEVSSLCNAKCVYCAHAYKNHGVYEGNMTMELFEKIIADVKEFPHQLKVMEMFSFGEPLCNPALANMIHLVKKERVAKQVNFTTNGLLFRPDVIDQIIDAEPDIIRISLQGLDAKAYWDTCRVKIDFEEFISNLTYLYKNKKKCSIRMKIADVAIKDVPNGEEKFKDLFGPIADSIFVENIIPMYAGVDYHKIDSDIYKHSINGRENIQQNEIHVVCQRPFYRLRVSANGQVTAACCDIPNDIRFGNINEESLNDIWNGQKRRSFLKMQLEGRRFEYPNCKYCTMPNDITTEADILDPYKREILERLK